MADYVIRVDPLNPFSVAHAQIAYRRLLREFDRKVDIFLERIAEHAREVADQGYGGAVNVTVEPIDNGYAIIAEGRAVGFLEFGAGDTVNSGNMFADQVDYEVRSGSYSETHARQYELMGRWVFGGIVYTQVTPRNAMQGAWDSVQQEWRSIAEEVFT